MKSELQRNNEELTKSGNALRQQYDELERVQKELTSSEERYSMLFMRMLNGFSVFEPVISSKGKIVDIRFIKVNPAFKRQTGLSDDKIVGKTWLEVYNFPNKNLGTYYRILSTGKPEQFETYYSQIQNYYLTSAFKISDNQVGAVIEDITDYKQAIKEITTLNEELEQHVAERTEELQSAVNELEAFAYTVSHDLKSPLRAIDGYSRIVNEDYGPKLGEDGSEMLQNIRNICRDMIEMISKLLQYSTTSKATITKEKIDIETVLRSIFNELLSANLGRNIKLVVETGLPEVLADKVMIRQVIYNILSNAVKFTKYKEQALITVGCTITAEEYIFYIKDNGVGFDMDFSRKLFGIFQRLHTVDEFEGSGIGLVTVKKIIQRHGGRVWIQGSIDLGAAVYFAIPIE
jgi:PAS domain S-box-containing protein